MHTHTHTYTDTHRDTHTHTHRHKRVSLSVKKHLGKLRENESREVVEVSELLGKVTHRLNVWHVKVLKGGADGSRGGGVLAPSSSRVEDGAKRQIQGDVMLMGADNAKEVQSVLW